MRRLFPRLVIVLGLLVAGGLNSACSPSGAGGDMNHPAMAPLDGMPADVRSAPVTVRQAYQFAVANPDVVEHLPCYCGCGAMGHASNYACYVAGVNDDGTPIFDSHALGCGICVDITQDAMRLLRQGKTLPQIREYVDTTYSRYGPSNMP